MEEPQLQNFIAFNKQITDTYEFIKRREKQDCPLTHDSVMDKLCML